MPTERETALTTLAAAVGTALGVTVTRESDIALDHLLRGTPRVVLGDGTISDSTPFFSPLTYEIIRRAELRIAYAAATEALRDSGIDAVLLTIGATIRGNRTLGGAVEWAECQPPEADSAEMDGAARVVLLPVDLTYTTADLAAA